MTDKFYPSPLKQLLKIILDEYDTKKSIFGIYEELFFKPSADDNFRFKRFGKLLENPIGVAAGPHTQLSQNIVAAWLTGARYIELKTIQTLDELEVSKPCIDMQDEGYNCEWSQELKINQSFNEYLNAWILIHILKDKLNIGSKSEPGFIFNMSVGYDMQGIMKENVQWFFDKMQDASEDLSKKINEIKDIYPNAENLNISPKITDNITLSTMHGCPPDEIEQIAEYLIEKRNLHTTIKLNPTLIGKKDLREIIADSGFNTDVPDEAFEHDVKYPDAVSFIERLIKKASNKNVFFGLKLTNTLESINNKEIFPKEEKMMYASGKVLHPISINVARKLQNDFYGKLDISFSGGADAFNINDIVNCGLYPVTVSSDLLKPGGYGRLKQYIENLRTENSEISKENKLQILNRYADKVKKDKKYKKKNIRDLSIKTHTKLNKFDCTFAPCELTCPTNQGIPSYMYYTAKGDFNKAYEVILETNPFPNATGMVCDHTCQTKCTRINYDSSLRIRDIKRFVTEYHNTHLNNEICVADSFIQENLKKIKVAVIGAGPSGMSAAYFLNKAGFEVEIFEAKEKAGGMVTAAIPEFRLGDAADIDINNIENEGVKIHYGYKTDKTKFEELRKNFDYVYIGAGAQDAVSLMIEGDNAEGLLNPLDFLYNVKSGKIQNIGKNIVIIGGGNTAMDAARTAYRLTENNGKVTILYRRTIEQMPAEYQEIQDVLAEGIEIKELVSPIKINSENGKIISLTCRKMKLGEKDASGRARPVEIPGSDFDLETDTIIPAIGQQTAIDFIDNKLLVTKENSYETKVKNVFIGGDAKRNASTLINAIADGRKAAREIIEKTENNYNIKHKKEKELSDRTPQPVKDLMLKKVMRIPAVPVREASLSERKNFKLVTATMTKDEAMQEASRCLLCDEVCNICTTLCPNLALQHYEIEPVKYNLQKIENGKILDAGIFEISQKEQIIHIADWCNMCANCETFCPTSGAPYKEKPHLYLNKTVFAKEKDGYFYDKKNQTLLAKDSGFDFGLTETENFYLYQSDNLIAKLDKKTLKILEYTGAENEDYDFEKAAEMTIIIKAAKEF